MVTTHARRPRRAASSAKAADTVVFPTPPEPQHTTMARSVTSSESPMPAPGAEGGAKGGGGTVLTTSPALAVALDAALGVVGPGVESTSVSYGACGVAACVVG